MRMAQRAAPGGGLRLSDQQILHEFIYSRLHLCLFAALREIFFISEIPQRRFATEAECTARLKAVTHRRLPSAFPIFRMSCVRIH